MRWWRRPRCSRKDRALLKARTQAGFDALVKNPMVDASKVALIGYCFGGAVGVEFGSTGAPLAANVSIHGSFGDHRARLGEEHQGHVPDPARRRGHGLIRSPPSPAWSTSYAPPRSRSRWRSTAEPAMASRGRRTRPRSAPTLSRSPPPGGRSSSCSAFESGINAASVEWVTRSVPKHCWERAVSGWARRAPRFQSSFSSCANSSRRRRVIDLLRLLHGFHRL